MIFRTIPTSFLTMSFDEFIYSIIQTYFTHIHLHIQVNWGTKHFYICGGEYSVGLAKNKNIGVCRTIYLPYWISLCGKICFLDSLKADRAVPFLTISESIHDGLKMASSCLTLLALRAPFLLLLNQGWLGVLSSNRAQQKWGCPFWDETPKRSDRPPLLRSPVYRSTIK